MLGDNRAFSGFAVDDFAKARQFYGETLGVRIEVQNEAEGLMTLHHPDSHDTWVYAKPDHEPANYTILNFVVDDIEGAVDDLTSRGVSMERYEQFDQDERGIAHPGNGGGPRIAWFTDPAGNILSVHDGA
jgi:predicted enzyme related to lactoylglutathione lyase